MWLMSNLKPGRAGKLRNIMCKNTKEKTSRVWADLGREQGYLTFDQLNALLPQDGDLTRRPACRPSRLRKKGFLTPDNVDSKRHFA